MRIQLRGRCWLRTANGYDPKKSGWRQRLAWWLRGLADRLTGETSWTVHFVAEPGIHPDDQTQCVAAGMDHALRLANEITRANLSDIAARRVLPDKQEAPKQ